MTLKEQLENRFGHGLNISAGDRIISENLWSQAWELARGEDSRLAFRAAWALQWADNHSPEEECFAQFCSLFMSSSNGSVLRICARQMLSAMPVHDALLAERIAGRALDLMFGGRAAVALRVLLLEMLFRLRDSVDYLPEILDDLLSGNADSPAMAVCLKRLRLSEASHKTSRKGACIR